MQGDPVRLQLVHTEGTSPSLPGGKQQRRFDRRHASQLEYWRLEGAVEGVICADDIEPAIFPVYLSLREHKW